MNEFLVFEDGPSQTFNLQWATVWAPQMKVHFQEFGVVFTPVDDVASIGA